MLLTGHETRTLFEWIQKPGSIEKKAITIKNAASPSETRWSHLGPMLLKDGFFKQETGELFDLNRVFASGLKLQFQSKFISATRPWFG